MNAPLLPTTICKFFLGFVHKLFSTFQICVGTKGTVKGIIICGTIVVCGTIFSLCMLITHTLQNNLGLFARAGVGHGPSAPLPLNQPLDK